MLSKTSLPILLDFSRDICMLVRSLDPGTRPSSSLRMRRAESRFAACTREFGAHDNMVDFFTLMFIFSLGMYCSDMIVVERMQCVNDNAVKYLYGCFIPSFIICNANCLRDSEQHICVLGLCLMALDVHPRMLGQAHQGHCLNRCLVPLLF